ncbi:MAG: hypothetical protein ABIK89_03165, partial [Planctomycetota bacterium]
MRIGNRPFDGNTVNYNNRQFHVGSNSYRPSYYRHSGYHGYWNGNRGFAGNSGYRFGGPRLGVGIGLNSGYGGYSPGWGWGLGNAYGWGGYGGG